MKKNAKTVISSEHQYLDLLRDILENGDQRDDRTGTGTLALFGQSMKFDLSDGTIPLLTTKRVAWKLVIKELLWFLSGATNIRPLVIQNVHIWDDWPHARYVKETGDNISVEEFAKRIAWDEEFAAKHGELGPVYGNQWRRWKTRDGGEIDQIAEMIVRMKKDPFSRRHLFHAWNVEDIPDMALPPCHLLYTFSIDSKGLIHGSMTQRSTDVFLGLPFNIFSCSILIHMIAQQTGYKPGSFTWFGQDNHVYLNHIEQVKEQLTRNPRPLPKLVINRTATNIDDYRLEDFEIEGYDPHPVIKAPIAV